MDFQPVFMAGFSLRDKDDSRWQKIQKPIVASKSCSICSFVATEKGKIHADEVWSFVSPPNVTLADVRPLCTWCHDAKDYSQLQRMVAKGIFPKSRLELVRQHYCRINECLSEDFEVDLAAAYEAKRSLEDKWDRNCRPVVDYGEWGRPAGKPKATTEQVSYFEEVWGSISDPIEIGDQSFTSYNSFVRHFQSLHISERDDFLRAAQEAFEDYFDYDDDSYLERDEGVQWE